MTTLNPTVAAGIPFSASADLDGDGINELVITRSHPAAFMPDIYNGSQTSAVLILSFSAGQPVDATARFIGTQPPIVAPSGLLIGDYNGDGRKDTCSGVKKAVEIATLPKKLAMTHKDFFVI